MRWIRRIGVAVILMLVVAGPPAAAALWWSTHDHPRWPTARHTRAWLDQPLTSGTILAAVVGVAALSWLAIVTMLAHTLARRLAPSWRRLRRMPLPTPAQATAGSMAGAAILGVPALAHPGVDHSTHPGLGTSPQYLTDGHHTEPAPAPRTNPAVNATAGIQLPDGSWIPGDAAHTVAALAGLIWLRRRHTYTPTTPPADDRDSDLQPLPATVDAITATVHTPPVSPPVPSDPLPLHELPDGHVYLTGPGATAAARGILVAALLSNAAHGNNPIRVTVSSPTLTGLLGTDRIDEPTAAPIVDPLPDAVDPAPATTGEPVPLVLTLTFETRDDQPEPPPRRSRRVVITVQADSPDHPNWHIRDDGTLTAGPHHGRRLCTLSDQTAADLISLIQQANDTPTPADAAAPAPAPAPADDAAPDRDPPRRAPTALIPPVSGRPHPTTGARLELLGTCHLIVNGQPTALRRSAALQTLTYLAVHPQGATTTQLTGALWPGSPPGRISSRLYTTISDLRTQLRDLIGDPSITRHHLLATLAMPYPVCALAVSSPHEMIVASSECEVVALRVKTDTR